MLNNKLSLKIDITDISEIDGSIELTINIKFLYKSCDCIYNDKLWFDEDKIKKFLKNLSIDKDCSLTDIDSDFVFKITKNKLNINIHKKDFYTKDNLDLAFEMSLDENLSIIKNAFEELGL